MATPTTLYPKDEPASDMYYAPASTNLNENEPATASSAIPDPHGGTEIAEIVKVTVIEPTLSPDTSNCAVSGHLRDNSVQLDTSSKRKLESFSDIEEPDFTAWNKRAHTGEEGTYPIVPSATIAKHEEIGSVNARDSDDDSLFNDEKEELSVTSPVSRLKHTEDDNKPLAELGSVSEDEGRPAKKPKTTTPLTYRVVNENATNRSKWLLRSLERETASTLKPIFNPESNQIAQKISLGAQIATPWDPFLRRKVADETSKLVAKTDAAKTNFIVVDVPTTRFKSWKDPNDESVTWKVFPKSTPRMKHRGGNIVVENILMHPQDHPDIQIEEYAEDSKCWIVRVEDITDDVLAGRRAALAEKAKNERMQRGRQTNGRGRGKGKKVESPGKKKTKSRKQAEEEEEETAEGSFVQTRKASKAAREKEVVV